MIDSVASGVLLALMSGVCFLAYTHTGRFRFVIPWLFGISFLLMLLGATWNSAITTAQFTLFEASSDAVSAKAFTAVASAKIPWYFIPMPWILTVALWLLTLLFRYLRNDGDKQVPVRALPKENNDESSSESISANKHKVKQPAAKKQ